MRTIKWAIAAIAGACLLATSIRATTPEPFYNRLWEKVAPDTNDPQVPNILEWIPAKTATPTAAVIIFPGGRYQSIEMQQEGENAADWFKAHGIAAFVIYYRVEHDKPFPLIPMHDGQRAVRWVRSKAAELNIDPHKIGMMGFGAGGHLVSTVATHFDAGDPAAVDPIDRVSCRPDFSVLVYPVISMKDGLTDALAKKNLLGANPDPAMTESLSNETKVQPQTPPTILFACADDTEVPIASDRLYFGALQKAGVTAEYHEYPTGGYGWGFGMVPDQSPPGWLDVTLYSWLGKLGMVPSLHFSPDSAPPSVVRIGNYSRGAPCGIAWVISDSAAFVLDTGGDFVAGTAAPDESYHAYKFVQNGANIVFEWGRVGNSVVGRLTSDKQVDLALKLSSGWPGWQSVYSATPDGATGITPSSVGEINWKLQTSPTPKNATATTLTVALSPGSATHFIAGLGTLPGLGAVDSTLKAAQANYDAKRPQASGDWGDFVGAIAANMNNSRIYSNDNHLLAHSVCRAWADTPNGDPYFCWDSFFTANLASLDDMPGAENTVRAMLSYQTPEGLVPNFAKLYGPGISGDRSQPPVASLCVWKMHQRYLNDADFLKEVYPKLVLWHDWWPKNRNAKGDGLLEWGSTNGDFQSAQYETGWDDNLHYAGAAMRGTTMNCYSIDLCSLWSMDAHYLALLADFLGRPDDATRFRSDEKVMNQKINDRLWNDSLNTYCSRFWDDAVGFAPALEPSVFGSGFDAEYFNDENLQTSVARHHDANVDFNWSEKSPIAGVASGDHWSARWTGAFTAPKTKTYRFAAFADDGERVFVDGKKVIDDWGIHKSRESSANVDMTQGKSVPVIVEYMQHDGGAEMHLSVSEVIPPLGGFLTRLTPMNFYALSAGAPDADRAKRALAILTDPTKFWGKYLLPTLAYDDPNYHEQEYWRGDIWGPTNYLTWVGIKKYASPPQINEFADRSVQLFMHEWLAKGVCGENYLSTDGTQNHMPHYTWGALLDLIGLESIVDIDDFNQIVLNGCQTRTITLTHIPILGRIYDVKTSPGSAQLIQNGKVVLTASGIIVRSAPP